jgi:hypothetical protein
MTPEIVDLETMGAGGRLLAIRKVKETLYIVQVAVAIVFSIVLVLLSGELQLVPLFIPLESFWYFLILIGLVFIVEAFVFRSLEIRFAKNATSSYYMVDKSQKHAVMGIIAVSVLLLLSLLPVAVEGVQDTMGASGSISGSIYFYNKDFAGITYVDRITLTSDYPAEAYLVTETIYLLYAGNPEMVSEYKLNAQYLVNGTLVIDMPAVERDILYLVVNGSVVQYDLHTAFAPGYLTYMPFLLAAYLVAFAGWIAYLMPLRLRLAKEAIYR